MSVNYKDFLDHNFFVKNVGTIIILDKTFLLWTEVFANIYYQILNFGLAQI